MLREGQCLTEFSDDLFFFIVERPYGHILRSLQFLRLNFTAYFFYKFRI